MKQLSIRFSSYATCAERYLIYLLAYLAEFGRYRAQSTRNSRDAGSRPLADKFPLRVISNNSLPPVNESEDESGESTKGCVRSLPVFCLDVNNCRNSRQADEDDGELSVGRGKPSHRDLLDDEADDRQMDPNESERGENETDDEPDEGMNMNFAARMPSFE